MRAFRNPYVVIAMAALAVHGLLLTNDGVYWDGWLPTRAAAARDWDALYAYFLDAGFPLYAVVHVLMGYLPDLGVAYRVSTFAALLAIGVLAYAVLRALKLATAREGLAVALIAVSYPAFAIAVSQFMVPILLLYAAFLLAALLAVRSDARRGVSGVVMRIGSLALFALSFEYKPLLGFYFGFLALRAAAASPPAVAAPLAWRARLLARQPDFLSLPFAYLALNLIFFPPRGEFAGAYPIATPGTFIGVYFGLAFFGIFEQLNAAVRSALDAPALVLIVLFFFVLLWRTTHDDGADGRTDGRARGGRGLLAAGWLLGSFAILPFAAVGRTPVAHGWLLRYTILLAIPFGLLVVSAVRIALPKRTSSALAAGLIVCVVLTGLFAATVGEYLKWQARWAKDRSVVMQLAETKGASGFSVYWIDDRFPIGGSDAYSVEYFHEWAALFRMAWGGQSRIGLDLRADTPNTFLTNPLYHTKLHSLAELDLRGCQADLVIRRGTIAYADAELAARYLYYRLVSRERLDDLLRRLTAVEVRPKPLLDARDCPAVPVRS